jgi:hypothetical protein
LHTFQLRGFRRLEIWPMWVFTTSRVGGGKRRRAESGNTVRLNYSVRNLVVRTAHSVE